MGRKDAAESKTRKHRAPKSTGKPSGRGFTGHRGRGRGRMFSDYDFYDPAENEESSENAENVDDEESSETSEGWCYFIDLCKLIDRS